jgi:hypothetical protein
MEAEVVHHAAYFILTNCAAYAINYKLKVISYVYYCLFTCGLLNDALNTSDCTALNDVMIS